MKTLTLLNAVSTFQKSGIQLPNINVILKRLQKFAISRPSKPQASNSITSNSTLPPLPSPSKSILNKTPCNAFEIVKVKRALKKKVDLYLSSPFKKAFNNFILAASSLVYQSKLQKGSIQLMQTVAKEAQKAADKARRYIPQKGAIRVGDGQAIVL